MKSSALSVKILSIRIISLFILVLPVFLLVFFVMSNIKGTLQSPPDKEFIISLHGDTLYFSKILLICNRPNFGCIRKVFYQNGNAINEEYAEINGSLQNWAKNTSGKLLWVHQSNVVNPNYSCYNYLYNNTNRELHVYISAIDIDITASRYARDRIEERLITCNSFTLN